MGFVAVTNKPWCPGGLTHQSFILHSCKIWRESVSFLGQLFLKVTFRHRRLLSLPSSLHLIMPSSQNVVKNFSACHPKVCCLGVLSILSGKALEKQQTLREAFSVLPYLPKDISPQKELDCHTFIPWEFHWPGKADSSAERRLEVDTTSRHTLSHTIILLICSSKGLFVFSKSHFLSSKLPFPPSPVKVVCKLSNLNDDLGGIHVFLLRRPCT